eukprot:1159582-Rhodomonas_salina.1
MGIAGNLGSVLFRNQFTAARIWRGPSHTTVVLQLHARVRRISEYTPPHPRFLASETGPPLARGTWKTARGSPDRVEDVGGERAHGVPALGILHQLLPHPLLRLDRRRDHAVPPLLSPDKIGQRPA